MAAQDLPEIPDPAIDARARQPLKRMQQELRRFMGFMGDPLDMAVTYRHLFDAGQLDSSFFRRGGPPGTIAVEPGPPGADGADGAPYTPDLTAPPSVTGLSATATFHHVIVEWDVAGYSVGHGPATTRIYAALRNPADADAVFADAVLQFEATHPLTIAAIPSELGTRWHIWATFVTVDGVESASPTGGTNGVEVTTGFIGNADLNDLIVSAGKLSQGTYPGINMVPNPSSEDGVESWEEASSGGSGGTLGLVTGSSAYSGNSSFVIAKAVAADAVGFCSREMAVIPGETYRVSFVASATNTLGALTLRMLESTTATVGGYVTDSVSTSYADLLAAVATSTGWVRHSFTYQIPAGVHFVSIGVYSGSTGTNCPQLVFDDCSFGRQITAEHLAANSIAVGTLAVQNGALVNAMIANATIDSAKIVSVTAASILAGSIDVGAYIQSPSYVAGTSGWRIHGDGTAELANVTVRGAVYASSGSFGGVAIGGALTMNTTGHIKGGQTAYNTGTGFFLGYDTSAYKFSIGSGASMLTWDGTTLSVPAVTITGTLVTAQIGVGEVSDASEADSGGFGDSFISSDNSVSGTPFDVVALTTTGQPIKAVGRAYGQINLTTGGGAVVYVTLTFTLKLGGVTQQFRQLRYRPLANGVYDYELPLAVRVAASAGSNTFTMEVDAAFYSVSFAPQTAGGSGGVLTSYAYLIAEELKV